MVTAIYALLIFGLVLLPFILFFLFDQRQKRRERERMLQNLNEAAQEHGLNFSSQEMLKGLVFGVDGTNRKMLVVEEDVCGDLHARYIDLNLVEACTAWKQYRGQDSKHNTKGEANPAPSRIAVLLHLPGKNVIEIPFYSSHKNEPEEATLLDRKAQHWEAILSKMLKPLRQRA
jgi:hypothetical protein